MEIIEHIVYIDEEGNLCYQKHSDETNYLIGGIVDTDDPEIISKFGRAIQKGIEPKNIVFTGWPLHDNRRFRKL